jgi:chemotaxis protein CheZ
MTNETGPLSEDYIDRVRTLAQTIELGDTAEATRQLDELTSLREKTLYQELGRLTREFHEALQSFRLDSRIASLAAQDFPDARERLNYVVSMTAQSADRTMTAVEESMPICESMEERAAALKQEWGRFTQRKMSPDEFRDLSRRLGEFLDSVSDDAPRLRANLQEVLMAQDFQDLTGQIIHRVVQLVDEVESNLVELIRISGQGLAVENQEEKKEDRIAASGPPVPGVDTGTVAGQDEVDDLLSSLGF